MSTLTVTVPDAVANDLAELAKREGVSPEEWVARVAERHVTAERDARAFFAERAKGADWNAFDRVFGSGLERPAPGDEAD